MAKKRYWDTKKSRNTRDALVGWIRPDFGQYGQAYRMAGEALVKQALAERLEDFYVYPIGYIYRHALELALKHANYLVEEAIAWRVKVHMIPATECRTTQDVESELKALASHGLIPLLDRLEKRLGLIKGAQAMDAQVRAAIAGFDQFDPDGQRFRYPERTKGRGPSFSPEKTGQLSISLAGMTEILDPAIGYFTDGLDGWLSADMENSADYKAFLDDATPTSF